MILRLVCFGTVLVCAVVLWLVIANSVKECTDRQHMSCWFGLRVIVR